MVGVGVGWWWFVGWCVFCLGLGVCFMVVLCVGPWGVCLVCCWYFLSEQGRGYMDGWLWSEQVVAVFVGCDVA